ncbi:MAG: radical SAM protein [Candidatus Cloacimonetes bacterium]|nr:radical SAM protein [Candidatus Cloacimonadota bacterium]MBS3766572.1 radical SAM protein [Candidatus Cloacimonadota bacterium]
MNKPLFLQTLPKVINNYFSDRPINSVTEIKVTHACNQRCRQCNIYKDKSKPIHLSYKKFEKICRNLKNYGSLVGMISGGEPLLNSEIDKILLHSLNIFPLSVSLVTGLYFPYEKIADTITLCLENNINLQTSLDALGKKSEYIRGVKNHSEIVLKNMQLIAEKKQKIGSSSFLYANCVLSNLNLEQVPHVIKANKNAGWKTTIGVYHSLIERTNQADEMKIASRDKFNQVVEFLTDNPDVLNLNTFIKGLPRVMDNDFPDYCPFLQGKRTSTRLTLYENGDLYLCGGKSIGNLLDENLKTILESAIYQRRLQEYKNCQGCWSSCYTQKHLLFHPNGPAQALHNISKLLNLKTAAK